MAPLLQTLASLVVLAFSIGRVSAAVGPTTNLVIANKVIAPDGFSRSAVLAGSSSSNVAFPGPLIRGNKGARFRINLVNQLSDTSMLKTTSIHWHGLFQAGTSWADGPAFVTQCPIASGDSFLYDFRSADQAGTFWYHAHLSTQYCDGLRGAFVVYDHIRDRLKYGYLVDNEDTVITLADWYHTVAPQAGLVPTPDATLINGRGRYAGSDVATPLAVIRVIWGIKYRFRLVSTSCDPFYDFSIDGHTMTVIEADGILTRPLQVDSIRVFAGQRYSFILHANKPINNYWIRAEPNLGARGFEGGINSAILRYIGAPRNREPTTTQTPSTNPLVEANLIPDRHPGAPGVPQVGAADVNLNLAMAFNFAQLEFTINGHPYTSPTSPVLLQIMSGASSATDLLPEGAVYVLPPNKVIELSIPALQIGQPHPFHLHGHAFDVIRSAGSTNYNFVNPPRRDVVSTGNVGDNVTIRFVTDNAGPWFLHCHIDWHLEIGLAVVFAEDVGKVSQARPPPAWDALCPKYDSLSPEEKGGLV
uniref:Laccase n=1 Tax=Pleurotus salmoneostramineus TaxID=64638 RepID=D2KZ07_9AGAR|nr:laccase [Pleurotus salmoneostramineus]